MGDVAKRSQHFCTRTH